jgi:hypothetical protein
MDEAEYQFSAPRSHLPALQAYAIRTSSTPIASMVQLCPDLLDIRTEYSSPTISPPECRAFHQMRAQLRPPMYFGYESMRPIPMPRVSVLKNGPGLPPRPHPPPRSKPYSSPSYTGNRVGESGLQLRSMRESSSKATTAAPPVEPVEESTTVGDQTPSKKHKPTEPDPSASGQEDTVLMPNAKTMALTDGVLLPNAKTMSLMTRIAKARTKLIQATSKVTCKGDGVNRKRKAGELDDDEQGSQDDCDMNMEIDD